MAWLQRGMRELARLGEIFWSARFIGQMAQGALRELAGNVLNNEGTSTIGSTTQTDLQANLPGKSSSTIVKRIHIPD